MKIEASFSQPNERSALRDVCVLSRPWNVNCDALCGQHSLEPRVLSWQRNQDSNGCHQFFEGKKSGIFHK